MSTNRITKIDLVGEIQFPEGGIHQADALTMDGTITLEDGATVTFNLNTATVALADETVNRNEATVNAWKVFNALARTLQAQIKMGQVAERPLDPSRPSFSFQINGLGATQGQWEMPDAGMDMATAFSTAIYNLRTLSPKFFNLTNPALAQQ